MEPKKKEIEYLKKEIDRLNHIIEAYEKFREFSHKELKEAKNTIQAYEEIHELSRIEQLSLKDEIQFYSVNKRLNYNTVIKKLLDRCPFNEERVMQIIKKKYPDSSIYSTLIYILVNYEFPEEEAKQIWEESKKIQKEMQEALKRDISFRVALLDYMINTKKLFKNPITIEIELFEKIKFQSITDELCKTYNRRFIQYIFKKELERAKRHKHSLSIVIMDIDNFKKINDIMGHLVGDKVLKLFSKVVNDNIRYEDSFGRIGGEEFLLILPETPLEKATIILERIRNILSEVSNKKLFFTFSCGISSYPEHADNEVLLLHFADKALLKAKIEGKNRDYIYKENL